MTVTASRIIFLFQILPTQIDRELKRSGQELWIKPALGQSDDPVYNFDNVMEGRAGSNGWNPLDPMKAYLCGKAQVELLMRYASLRGNTAAEYLHAVFQNYRLLRGELLPFSVSGNRAYRNSRWCCPYNHEKIVFVSVAEPVEQHQHIGMVARVSKSLIWLDKPKEPIRSRAHSPELLESSFFKVGSVPEYWEAYILNFPRFDEACMSNEEVESGARVVNDISDHSGPTDRNWFLIIKENVRRTIKVLFKPKSVRVTLEVSIDEGVEVLKVLLGSLYLCAWTER